MSLLTQGVSVRILGFSSEFDLNLQCRIISTTHIRHKGRLHHSSLHPLEVDVFEERVGLDACCSIRLAPQPLLRVFGEQLGEVEAEVNHSIVHHSSLAIQTSLHQASPFYRWPWCPL